MPAAIDPNIIPPDLRDLDNWVVWKWVERDGKPTKPPVDPKTGRPGDATDPSLWMSFDRALAERGHFDGIGFAVTAETPYTGIDLDKCIDPNGVVAEWATAIVDRFNSYTERTPSGTGLRIWVKGKLPQGRRRKGNVEMYDSGRYFTVTGEHLEGTPTAVANRGQMLADFHGETFPAATPKPSADRSALPAPDLSDRQLLDTMFGASNGREIEALWGGDQSRYASESEADLALCSHLAFYTGDDEERIDRLFRLSGLMRPKWERADYRAKTIGKAVGGNVYAPNRVHRGTFATSATSANGSQKTEQESEWEQPRLSAKAPVEPFPLDVFPIGLQELCRLIADSMGCPVDYPASFALALAGAAVGLSVVLKIKERWYESPALYMAVVGSAGTKKSPPLRELAGPFNEIDRELREQYEIEKAEHEIMEAEAKARKATSTPPPTLRATRDRRRDPRGCGPNPRDQPAGLGTHQRRAFRVGHGPERLPWRQGE